MLAERRSGRVTSVDKANVLATSKLWRRVAGEVAERHPGVTLEHQLVDSMAMLLVERPAAYDVIVTENLFGDVLSDLAAAVSGGIGLAPSASLADGGPGIFEPIHGSAPDIAGSGKANPAGAILSVALLLDELGQPTAARAIERAVTGVLDDGARTPDLGGTATTDEVADEDRRRTRRFLIHRPLTDRESSYVHRREAARLRRGAPAQSLRRPTPHRRGGRYPLARDVWRRDLLRDPRRGDPSDLRRARLDGNDDQARAGAPRAGRRPHGAGLCPRDGQGRRRHGDLGARRDESRHAGRRRLPGLDAARDRDGAGPVAPDRHGRLPGGRHDRHLPADRQALLPRHEGRRHPARVHGGLPPGLHRAPGPGADRHPEGHRQHGVHVPLAQAARSARLPADGQGPPAADPGGGARDRARQEAGAVRRRRRHQRRRRGRAARSSRRPRASRSSRR